MSVSFSHQSCAMEGNSLGIGDTEKIWSKMNEDYNLDELLEPEEIQLPDARSLPINLKMRSLKSVTIYIICCLI